MTQAPTPLPDLARLFLKLGATAFGGPAAHIAMMEEEVVRKRQWLTHQEFLDLLGATQLIPGPNSTEMAIHIGHRQAGWPGLLVAGLCFILPAFIIVLAAAWGYVTYGTLPAMQGALYGIKPVIIAVIIQALWHLGWQALKSYFLAAIALIALALNLAGVSELLVLLGLGAGAGLLQWHFQKRGITLKSIALAPVLLVQSAPIVLPSAATFGLWPLFWFFLKVGSVLFGSGYVLIAFLQADLVDRYGWLTQAQLLDAVAIGQVTPGPVFTTATFIGYILGGWPGAFIATLGIFLPAFFFVALSAPWVARLRQSPRASHLLDSINATALALMAAVTIQLASTAFPDILTISIGVLSALLLIRFRINSVGLIILGGLIGWLASKLQ